MTQYWTILDAVGAVLRPFVTTSGVGQHPNECGEPWEEGYQAIPLDFAPDAHRMKWNGSAWILDPQVARDMRADEARAYREQLRTAALPVWGVFPDRAVTVKMDVESRITIMGAFNFASFMAAQGLSPSFGFTDAAGQAVTIDGAQTIALGLGVAVFSGTCDTRLGAILAALDAALAAGATVEEITAIDITAGYPTSPAP